MFWRQEQHSPTIRNEPSIRRVAGMLSALALCVSIAGVNLPNPLVPLYAERFGLTPLLESALFSAYLLALLVTLVVTLARPAHSMRTEVTMVIAAMGVVVVADLTMLAGSASFALLVLGRVIAGVAAGIATGAASAVALAGLGERSRTVAGTAAVVGALAANLLGGLLGAVLPVPFPAVYLGHATVAALIGAGLWSATSQRSQARGAHTSRALHRTQPTRVAHPVAEVVGGYHRRHRVAGYVLGALAWSSAGIVLALVATQVRHSRPELSLFETMIPGCVFLACAWLGQTVCAGRMLQLRAWMTGLPLVVGTAGIGLALHSGNSAALLLAAAVAGLGQGPSYSLGLATVTHGLAPIQQAHAASTYAAVAYGVCGVCTLAVGVVANLIGVPDAIIACAGIFAVGILVTVVLAGPAQRVHFAMA